MQPPTPTPTPFQKFKGSPLKQDGRDCFVDSRTLAHLLPSYYKMRQKSKARALWEMTRLHDWPFGSIFVILPCVWSLTMAACSTHSGTYYTKLAVYTIGAVAGGTLLHSVRCIIEDVWDAKLDRRSERRRQKPLPSGLVTLTEAWLLLLACVGGIGCLLWFTNVETMIAASIGLLLVGAYPWVLRRTAFSRIWLGLTINWGSIISWTSLKGGSDIPIALIMLFGTLCWSVAYNTICPSNEHEDGRYPLPFTETLSQPRLRATVAGLSFAFASSLTLAGYLNNQGLVYLVVTGVGAAVFFIAQSIYWKPSEVESCRLWFNANNYIGYIVWAGLILDYSAKSGLLDHIVSSLAGFSYF